MSNMEWTGLGPRASGLVAIILCSLIPACSAGSGDDSSDEVDLKVREALTQRVRDDVADDIGTRITDDRPIRHEFRLHNPTDTPIRLINATALKSCCSSISPIPSAIPARGEVPVSVVWKAGHQSGRMRVQFVIATDRADCRTIDLSLTANLLPAWEVSPLVDIANDHLTETKSTQTFRMITRRLGDEGLSPPSHVDSAEPFSARFVGDATQEARPGGIVETTRIVEVALPPDQGAGSYSGELRLKWADGNSQTYPISRLVLPHIRLNPSTLIVNPNDGIRTYEVIVRSDERPFRIIDVFGKSLVNFIVASPDPSVTHFLKVGLDPLHLDRSGPSEIEVTTDHPAQVSLKVKVYLVASELEGKP